MGREDGREEGLGQGRTFGLRDALPASLARRLVDLAPEARSLVEVATDGGRFDDAQAAFADGLPLARILESLHVAPHA